MKIWLHETKPLLDATFDISSTLTNVTEDLLAVSLANKSEIQVALRLTSTRQAEVAIGLGEDFQIKHIQDTLIVERENAFENQHVRRVDCRRVALPCVLLE